jgi:hypothetical protein
VHYHVCGGETERADCKPTKSPGQDTREAILL